MTDPPEAKARRVTVSRKSKANRKANGPGPAKGKEGRARWASVLVAVVIVAGAAFWWLKPRPQESQPPSQPAVAAVARPEFQKLKGRWRRPDGGYVIDVKNVDESGRMDASYANPRPIHVAKAEASQEGAATKIFIELRDVNYPGSTYDLTYDPQTDRLAGIYYQAALQQSFEVFFIHMQ
jgi:hypothetical protein